MTAIAYLDLIAHSPSKKYRVEVRSPDNHLTNPRSVDDLPPKHPRRFWTDGFQSDFVYSLYDNHSGQKIASWPHPTDEIGPVAVWVGDNKYVIAITRWTFGSELLVFDETGKTSVQLDISKDILQENEYEFHWTSAGPHWNENSLGYFIELDDQPYWCLRTFFDRRVLIKLVRLAESYVPNTSPFEKSLDIAERLLVLKTIQSAVSYAWLRNEKIEERHFPEFLRVRLAVHLAGWLGLTETIDFLRSLESVPFSDSMTFIKIDDCSISVDMRGFRAVVQLALRRLNQQPQGYAPYLFRYNENDRQIVVPECLPNRDELVANIHSEMKPLEILYKVGAPDFLTCSEWEYDLGHDDDGATVKLEWKNDMTSMDVLQTIRPPKWKSSKERDLFFM